MGGGQGFRDLFVASQCSGMGGLASGVVKLWIQQRPSHRLRS